LRSFEAELSVSNRLPVHLGLGYRNASQIARVVTEGWAEANLLCPRCGSTLLACAANTRTKDFDCSNCQEHFQLKSCTKKLAGKFVGAEYRVTLESIQSGQHPSLILLRYSKDGKTVIDVDFIHRACISTQCLLPRKPLSANARRAGWQGCMIDLLRIPIAGRVAALSGGVFVPQAEIECAWAVADRLLSVPALTRGWSASLLRIVESLPSQFRLAEVYKFAEDLSSKYPNNRNVKAKIRQQLQVLRDLGFLEFTEHRGQYRRVARA
jgi:type II restriction enzyme